MTPRTDWQETIAPDETQRFETYAQQLGELQRKSAVKGRLGRALHAKPHVGVRAQLTVLPHLPEHARVGIFAAPGTYQAWARYSSATHHVQSDRKPDLRGFAIKLLGVPGQKLIPGMETATTQDLLLLQTPKQSFKSTDEFVFFVLAATQPLTLLPKAIWRLGLKRTLAIIKGFTAAAKPLPSLAGQQFWSTAPIRWGAYAAKYSLLPLATVPSTEGSSSPNYLAEGLTDQLAKGTVEYDLAVQFYSDPGKTPIEDLSIEWLPQDAPFVRVARLTIAQQDLHSEAGQRQQAYVETLSFDPWHAPVEFRPLGDVQRARNVAYRVSTMARGAAKEAEGPEALVP